MAVVCLTRRSRRGGDFVAFVKNGREIYHVNSWQELEKLVSNKNNGNTISQAY